MNDETGNVLEAKLYEAVDQFAALSGIAGVRSDEAGVLQTAGDDASSAIAASDGAQSPSSVIMSGVTSTAPRSEALPSDDGSSTAPPVAGLSGNSARSGTPSQATNGGPQSVGEMELAPLDLTGADGPTLLGRGPSSSATSDTGSTDGSGTDTALPDEEDDQIDDNTDGLGEDGSGGGTDGGEDGDGTDGDVGTDTTQGGGDTDLTADLNIDLPVVGPIIADVDIGLDPAEDLLDSNLDVSIDLDADVGDAVGGTVDDILGSSTDGSVISVDLNIDPPVGPVIVDVDTDLDLVGDGSGDNDLSVDVTTDLPITDPITADVDVNLDPVEDLLGTDIDVDLDAVADLDGVTGTVGDIVDGLGGTSGSPLDGLADIGSGGGSGLLGASPDQTGDTDLTLDAVADLPLVAPIIADVDVNLDPVEDLLGTDIDVDLDAVADLDQAIAAVDSLLGNLGSPQTADATSTGDSDLSLHLDAFDQLSGGVDINLDIIEQMLATDIDVDVGFGLDLGNFDTLAGTDSGLTGGNLTLSELLTLDSGTSGFPVTNTLDVSTSTVSTVTTSTTSALTSLTQSVTGKLGGGLFG